MVTRKVSELYGAELDWAIAQLCAEYKTAHKLFPTMTLDPTFSGARIFTYENGEKICIIDPSNPMRQEPQHYRPSTDWSHGGAIVERMQSISSDSVIDKWRARCDEGRAEQPLFVPSYGSGDTLLIACCRAFVHAKLGDEVEVPE